MEKETETIEVEVVEIDGIAPVPVSAPHEDNSAGRGPRENGNWNDWRNWQGRVRTLDMRWWPLWVILGIILLALLASVGVVVGFFYLIFAIIRGFMRALIGK
jgi:hypothetical protein